MTRNFDLNLARTLVTLMETRNVTEAADRLRLSQPTVSYNLARLRRHFNDPLFNRTPSGIAPTTTAERLYPALRAAVGTIEAAANQATEYNPIGTSDQFHVALTDLGELLFLPRLLNALHRKAPQSSLRAHPLDAEGTPQELMRGDIDVMIATADFKLDGVERRVLFREGYVAVASATHPRLQDGGLNLEQFQSEQHVVVVKHVGHTSPLQAIEALQITHRVALEVSRFTAIPEVVERTELIAITPYHVAQALRRGHEIQLLPLPFPTPDIVVSMHSREAAWATPAQRWFADVCEQTLATFPGEEA